MAGPAITPSVVKYSIWGTAASLFIAYGLREFLRATGGGYYCCNHFTYQIKGIALTFIGWILLGHLLVHAAGWVNEQ